DADEWTRNNPAGFDEGADAQATAYYPDGDTTIGHIVSAYGDNGYQVYPQAALEHNLNRLSMSPEVEYARGGYDAGDLGNMPMGYHQAYGHGPVRFQYARHPPPGLPVPPPPTHQLYHYDCTDLPTSDQTYGATGELLRVTPPKEADYTSSYRYAPAETSMYPPMRYDANGQLSYPPMPSAHYKSSHAKPMLDDHEGYYHPHDNKENIPPSPRDSIVTNEYGDGIPAAWSNADLPRSHRAGLQEQDRRLHHTRKPFRVKDKRRGKEKAFDPDDEYWTDCDPADDPAEDFKAIRRESQFSYANTSDDGECMAPMEGGVCCMPSSPSNALPSLQAVRMSDRSAGHTLFAVSSLDAKPTTPEEAVHQLDVKSAIGLIKEVLQERILKSLYGGDGVAAAELRYNDMIETRLERLKVRNIAVLQEAADRVAFEVPNMRPPHGRAWVNGYNPHAAFLALMRKLDIVVADTRELPKSSTLPPQTGLNQTVRDLLNRPSPGSSPGLAFSPTFNSFRTISPDRDRIPSWIESMQKPSPVMTPGGRGLATPSDPRRRAARAIAVVTPGDSQRTAHAEDYEMHELVRHNGTTTGKGRPAMSGQTTLRPLQLGNTNLDSSTTSFVPGRRMTNTELAAREPNWTMSPEARSTPRTAFELPDNTPLLAHVMGRAAEAGGPDVEREQKRISIKYFALTALCPISALLYGLGYLDGQARRESEGRVDGMAEEDKLWALWLAAPLSLILYAIVIITVVVICKVVIV
ncbi:hypothetical protein LTR53_016941, partial [Teratosphaeriaceae sp. CCFEE 6253]